MSVCNRPGCATCGETTTSLIAGQLRSVPLGERLRVALDAVALTLRTKESAPAVEARLAEEMIG